MGKSAEIIKMLAVLIDKSKQTTKEYCKENDLEHSRLRSLLKRTSKNNGANIDNVEKYLEPLGYELRIVNTATGEVV